MGEFVNLKHIIRSDKYTVNASWRRGNYHFMGKIL